MKSSLLLSELKEKHHSSNSVLLYDCVGELLYEGVHNVSTWLTSGYRDVYFQTYRHLHKQTELHSYLILNLLIKVCFLITTQLWDPG